MVAEVLALAESTVAGPVVGVLAAVTLFLLTTVRGDVRELSKSRASQQSWRRARRRNGALLALGLVLLAFTLWFAVPAVVDLLGGTTPPVSRLVALGMCCIALVLLPFAIGNYRRAADGLATHRGRLPVK